MYRQSIHLHGLSQNFNCFIRKFLDLWNSFSTNHVQIFCIKPEASVVWALAITSSSLKYKQNPFYPLRNERTKTKLSFFFASTLICPKNPICPFRCEQYICIKTTNRVLVESQNNHKVYFPFGDKLNLIYTCQLIKCVGVVVSRITKVYIPHTKCVFYKWIQEPQIMN